MKQTGNKITCQHGTVVEFPSQEVIAESRIQDTCLCKPSDFAKIYKAEPSIIGSQTPEEIRTSIILNDAIKALPKAPKGSTNVTPDELKDLCITWFNTAKKSVSECSYDEITQRAHDAEYAMLKLQTEVKAFRSQQYELLEGMDEEKKREYLKYKPVPLSIKEKLADSKTSQEKRADKLESEIQSTMQTINLTREMAITFLQKMKPNLFK